MKSNSLSPRRSTVEIHDIIKKNLTHVEATNNEVSLCLPATKEICEINEAEKKLVSPSTSPVEPAEDSSIAIDEILPLPKSMEFQSSFTLRGTDGEPYDPNLHLKCFFLYMMQFCQVVFTAPIYIVVPIYLENEFHGKKGKFGPRPERWGFEEKITTMIILTLASLDFIMPLITPYIYKYIKYQHFVSNCLAILSTFCFMLADMEHIDGCLWFMIVGGICNSFGNSFHIIEIYIRFISPLKSKQSEIIETNMIIFVVSTIIVIIMVSGLYMYGESTRKGMTFTAVMGSVFGAFAMTCQYFFYSYVDVDMSKLKNKIAKKAKKKNVVTNYWSPSITVILICRFFISFNQAILKLVIIPLMQSTDDGHGLEIWLASTPVVFGIISAVMYLYFTKDPFHDHPWFWYPYPEGIACFCVSCLLCAFIIIGTSTETSFPRLIILGVMFFFGFVLQAKMTIDRNVMTNNFMVDKSASLSLICNGSGVLTATIIAAHLKSSFGVECMYINVVALFLLSVGMFSFFHMRSGWLTKKLEKYGAKFSENSTNQWSEKLLKILLAKVEEKTPMSEVAKERLFAEMKSTVCMDEKDSQIIKPRDDLISDVDDKEHGELSYHEVMDLSSSFSHDFQ